VPALFRVPRSYRGRWSFLLDSLPWGGWHWHFITTEEDRHIAVLSSVGVTILCVSCYVSSPPLFPWSVPYATCTTHHSSVLLCTFNYTPFRVYSVYPIPFCKSLTGLLNFSTHPIYTQSLYIYIPIHLPIKINQLINQLINKIVNHLISQSSNAFTESFRQSIRPSIRPVLAFLYILTPDDEGTAFLWNIKNHLPSDASHLIRTEASITLLWSSRVKLIY
jgi:hypothetical protein